MAYFTIGHKMKLFFVAFFFFISKKLPLSAHKNYNTIDPPRKKILELPLFKLFFFGEKNRRSTIEDLQQLFFKSFFVPFFFNGVLLKTYNNYI